MLPTHREILETLIGTPSISSSDPRFDQSNRGVVDALANWAESLGFRCEVRPVPDVAGKYNLIARLGGRGGAGAGTAAAAAAGTGTGTGTGTGAAAGAGTATGLVLSGHSDTVPFDQAAWSSDPFVLTERGDRYHGLGTADMKGFFAAALHAVHAATGSSRAAAAARLVHPLTLLATADEESTMSGARALCDDGAVLGAVAVIGEPTGLEPVRKHKGIMMARVVIEGRAGHASEPARGVNAIEGAHRVLDAVRDWASQLASAHRDQDFAVEGPTVNVGRIAGGDSPNRICARCEIDIDVRFLPDMVGQELLATLARVAADAVADGEWQTRVEPLGACPSFSAEDSTFQRNVESVCGCSARAVMFGTEAPYLAQLGLDTVVLGAGDIGVAHKHDEYIEIAAMKRATEVYARLIQKHCMQVQP